MPLLPQGSDLKVNAPLTNISIAYQQQAQDYVAARIFPSVPVSRQGDLYYVYDKGDWFRSIAGLRAPATETPGGGWRVSTESYYANVYGVHKDIDDQTRANADSVFRLDRDATQWVTQNLLLKRDQLFASKFFTTGVWTGASDTNGGGGGGDLTGTALGTGAGEFKQWNNADSQPIEDVRAQATGMKRTTGYRPNVMAISPEVYDVLLDHPTILERIKYTERGIVSDALLASLFEVDRVVVIDTIQNTANLGATDAMSFLVGKHAGLFYSNPNPGLMQPSAGYIFPWTGLLGGGAYSTRIKRFRMEAIASDRIEGEMAFDQKVIAADLGVFFSAAVA